MAFGTRAQFEAVREIAFGSIGASYSAVGTATTDHARVIIFTNTTDKEVYLSLDGATNMMRFPANSYRLIDFSTNRIRDDGLFIPVGTLFYVKQVNGVPASGAFWIEVIYGAGGV